MGGATVLTFLASPSASPLHHQIRGSLLSAPFIALPPSTRPSAATLLAGRVAAKLVPKRQLARPIAAEHLSRDPAVGRAFVEDPLCHDTGTLEGLAGMLERAGALERGRVRVPGGLGDGGGKGGGGGGKTRVWVGHGTKDRVCDFEATRKVVEEFMGEVEDREWKVYEGWYHKCEYMLMRLGKRGVVQENGLG